ncbi:MAG: tyrosine-type recombinase/integrase [Clostridia bacterium]|jgi:integrase|nr:tyrosine-type recombinase/integrase [Clostridia bacterium]
MYSLRHTFATRCEEAGISVKQTAQWMGHSDIHTTLNNYIGIQTAFEKDNIKKKNDID